MGEGTAGLNQASPRETARQIEGEISRLREELGALVGELDRRRHELLDVKLQVKRHALAATLTGVSLVAAASGLVWLGIWHAQRRHGALSRAGRLREAVSRMVDRPERVAAEPTVPARIVAGVLTAAAATLIKKGLEWGVQVALERRGPRGSPRPSGHPGGTA